MKSNFMNRVFGLVCVMASCLVSSLYAQNEAADKIVLNSKVDGFRGIWYAVQPTHDEYVFKCSGGLGTHSAKHIPLAWYAEEVDKTFFVYGGSDERNSTLLHMISYFDHRTGRVAKPTLILDKKVADANDNPVLNIDDRGHLWVFSSSHDAVRPSYISRSLKPFDSDRFECVWTGNFLYPAPFFFQGKGFLFMQTRMNADRRTNCFMTSRDGIEWSDPRTISDFEMGHYQVANPSATGKMGTAFNMHPNGKGLDWRTNIYYMESADFGKTWTDVRGGKLDVPLASKSNPALVLEYESRGRNVYIKDVQYDSKGNPIILFVLSKGFEAGPEKGPREWRTVHWNGREWVERNTGIASGNNYDTGPIYIESDTCWRLIGPTEPGPQPFNPGGEIAMWLSQDAGESWKKVRQMTAKSEFNHTYVRRPVHAHPDFYALWADGDPRRLSQSRIYFSNRQGDVFRLPWNMTEDFAIPEKIDVK